MPPETAKATTAAPCAACGDPLSPRTRGRYHRGCKPDDQAEARPQLGDACRLPLTLSLMSAGAAGLAHLYAPGLADQLVLGTAGLLLTGPLVHSGRLDRWERRRNTQVLWDRLARVTGDSPADRRAHLKVGAFEARVPVDVTVRPGPNFEPQEVGRLRAALAASAGVDDHQVRSERGRGCYRLWVDEAAQAPLAQVIPMQLALAPADDTTDVESVPLNSEAALERITEALRAVLDDDTADVKITAWSGGAPTELVLTYPPRVAPRALERRADLADTMRALHHPAGDWFVHWDPQRDRYLIADRPDPLAPVVPLPPIETDLDCAAGPVLGVTEEGKTWRQPLLGGHVLIAGASGSGKGSVLWGIVRGLSGLIADGRARLWIIDPKGGMEFGAARGFAHRFAVDEDEILELLAEAVAQMQTNARQLAATGSRKVTAPTVERPLNVVLVDEIASVTAYMSDPKKKTEAAGLLSKLLSQGRAGAYVVVGALQDPRAEVLKMRNLFTFAVALALNEAPQVDMVLGRGIRSRGAVCDAIPKTMQGTGYVVADGVAEPRRVRAAYLTDEDIERLAEQIALPPTV